MLSIYKYITSKKHSCVQGPLRECRSIRSGASGLPYYCTPPMTIPALFGLVLECGSITTKRRKKKAHSVTQARLYDDAQSDDDDDDLADILEALLGRAGQREDSSYDDDGVDVSVGVDVGAVVGVGVNGQRFSLGVGLGVGLVVGFPPITSLDSWGACLRSGSLMA